MFQVMCYILPTSSHFTLNNNFIRCIVLLSLFYGWGNKSVKKDKWLSQSHIDRSCRMKIFIQFWQCCWSLTPFVNHLISAAGWLGMGRLSQPWEQPLPCWDLAIAPPGAGHSVVELPGWPLGLWTPAQWAMVGLTHSALIHRTFKPRIIFFWKPAIFLIQTTHTTCRVLEKYGYRKENIVLYLFFH